MRETASNLIGIVLLLIAIAAGGLWVRSFWVSDWLWLVHRHAPNQATQMGAATLRGSFAAYVGGPNGSDYGNPRNTIVQFNRQRVGDAMILPFDQGGPRWLGFGWFKNSASFFQIILPGWFVALLFGIPGNLLLRRELRIRRRRRSGACIRCGYDLRAAPDRCPECGTAALRLSHPSG